MRDKNGNKTSALDSGNGKIKCQNYYHKIQQVLKQVYIVDSKKKTRTIIN